MQAGRSGKAAAGSAKGGRPKKDESIPPMPKSWKRTERLAGCLAYQEVSEKGPNANLEADVANAYGKQLVFVDSTVESFVVSKHKWKKGFYDYTMEESIKRRPFAASDAMINNYLDTRKYCNNTISPIYVSLHNKDGPVS